MPGVIHINIPRYERMFIRRFECIYCKAERFFVVGVQEWYGRLGTCLKCGERFGDDEWLPRPFCRGWRKDNIAQAKQTYRKWKQQPPVVSDQTDAKNPAMFEEGQKVRVVSDEHGIMTGQVLDADRGCVGVIKRRFVEDSSYWWVEVDGDEYLHHANELKAI